MTGWKNHTRSWTDEEAAEAKRLWDVEGRSASEIAKIMGGGITRNAVIGRLSRAGAAKRSDGSRDVAARVNGGRSRAAKPAAPRRINAAPVAEKPVAFPKSPARYDEVRDSADTSRDPPPAATEPFVEGVEPAGLISDLAQMGAHMCKWPIGDPRDPTFSFCGRSAAGVYCPSHQARAWTSKGTKERLDQRLDQRLDIKNLPRKVA